MNVYLSKITSFPRIIEDFYNPDGTVANWDPQFPNGKLPMLLESFYFIWPDIMRHAANAESFMLDSGAFTFCQSKKRLSNLDDYIIRYCDWINAYGIDLFYEMDIDDIIGYADVRKLRARIEQLTGKQPIPVYHFTRSLEDFRCECRDYGYVAFGGIAKTRKVDHDLMDAVIDIAHENGAKIHCMGYTNMRGLVRHHFDSVDSSSWSTGVGFGCSYTFTGTKMQWHDKPSKMHRGIPANLSRWNFREWVKFQKYAKFNL